MFNYFIRCVSTFFFVGYLPKAPGSIASICGVLLAVALYDQMAVYLIVLSVVTLLGFLFSGKMEGIVHEKDPSCVVIDEVAGVMIAFFMLPLSWPVIWTGFFLFRAFDMFKIYPANVLEKFPGSRGIMFDDIAAGIYTNIVMQVAIQLAGNRF